MCVICLKSVISIVKKDDILLPLTEQICACISSRFITVSIIFLIKSQIVWISRQKNILFYYLRHFRSQPIFPFFCLGFGKSAYIADSMENSINSAATHKGTTNTNYKQIDLVLPPQQGTVVFIIMKIVLAESPIQKKCRITAGDDTTRTSPTGQARYLLGLPFALHRRKLLPSVGVTWRNPHIFISISAEDICDDTAQNTYDRYGFWR